MLVICILFDGLVLVELPIMMGAGQPVCVDIAYLVIVARSSRRGSMTTIRSGSQVDISQIDFWIESNREISDVRFCQIF